MINRVILMGRLVSDPELKTTGTGTSVRIAVERSYVKQSEERRADFIDVVCWRNTAEFVCRYFGKGSLIAVEGQLQSRTYQAKDRSNRYVIEVIADHVSFTGERRDNLGSSYNQSYGSKQNYGQLSHINRNPLHRLLIRAAQIPNFKICLLMMIYHFKEVILCIYLESKLKLLA